MPPTKRTPPALPRLQRFLSECGVASRRSAEELIAAGKVSINGVVVTELGTRVDPEHSVVRVSNRIVKAAPKGVLLLHKPTSVVSTLADPEGRRSIADYLTKHYRSYFPVGRLDWDSSGLVILTNDGDLANHLLHPRYRIERVYHARVEGIPSRKTLAQLAKGVRLPDGPAACHAEILETADNYSWVEVTLSEGRNRIVRRLLEFVGHPVEKLKRVAHGPCKLGTLRPGDVRRLTEKEYLRLKRGVMGGMSGAQRAGAKGEDERGRRYEREREQERSASRRTRLRRGDGERRAPFGERTRSSEVRSSTRSEPSQRNRRTLGREDQKTLADNHDRRNSLKVESTQGGRQVRASRQPDREQPRFAPRGTRSGSEGGDRRAPFGRRTHSNDVSSSARPDRARQDPREVGRGERKPLAGNNDRRNNFKVESNQGRRLVRTSKETDKRKNPGSRKLEPTRRRPS